MSRQELFLQLWEKVGRSVADEYRFSPGDINYAKERMKAPFRDGHWNKEFMNINFNAVLSCVGYTLRVATCHSILTALAAETVFRNLPANVNDSLLNRRNIKITSVGGGPGCDLMGFLQVLLEKRAQDDCSKSNLNVIATILDYFAGWEEIVDKLREVVYDVFHHLRKNINLEIDFEQIDMRDKFEDISDDLRAMKYADVILMVKVLSVLNDSDGRQILKNVFRCMKPGSMLIFVDPNAEVVAQSAREYESLQVIIGPTERTTVTTDLRWQKNLMNRTSYELCVVQHIKQSMTERKTADFNGSKN